MFRVTCLIGRTASNLLKRTTETRFLYTESALGLDGFKLVQQNLNQQFVNNLDKFKEKMREVVDPKAASMVFSEDLKNMIHLSESSEDIELIKNMLTRFHKQNTVRFGTFIFGPVVMRMLYVMNTPDEALEMFLHPDLDGFFDQITTFHILMDLLFENKRYDDVIKVFELVKSKQIQRMRYPKHVIVLLYATLYKQNTKESLDYGINLWKELREVGYVPTRKASTFFAGLALNQGKAPVALEVVSSVNKQSYMTIRNLKLAALCQCNRADEAVLLLKNLIRVDMPNVTQKMTVNEEVLEQVKKCVEKSGDVELKSEFERISRILNDGGNISTKTLDEDLCLPMEKETAPDQRFGSYDRHTGQNRTPRAYGYNQDRSNYSKDRFQRSQRPQRPGLLDLE